MLGQFEGITRHAFTFPETKTIVTERTQMGRVFFTVYLITDCTYDGTVYLMRIELMSVWCIALVWTS